MLSRRRIFALGLFALAAAIVVCGAWFCYWREHQGVYDLLVSHGRVFDGDRFLPARTCIAVREGRIVAVGRLACFGRPVKRLDAGGDVVAPGFIDVHVHVERNIPASRPFSAGNFVRQGVTTLITGNCGTSVLDTAALFRGLEKNGSQVNVATLIGHNSVREHVMGKSSEPATPEQLSRMAQMVDANLAEGALGISTGLAYAPGCFARESEVVALARCAARCGGLYVTHMRDEGVESVAALDEALRIRRAAGVALHISHFKIAAKGQWGQAPARLRRLNEERLHGPPITMDLYAYNASSTSAEILVPVEYRGANVDWRGLASNAVRRDKLFQGMLGQLSKAGFEDYGYARIASFWAERSLNGRTIPEVAATLPLPSHLEPARVAPARQRRSGAGKHNVPATPPPGFGPTPRMRRQLDAVLHLLTRGGAQMIYFDMDPRDVATIMKDPHASFGTDSAVRYTEQATTHPRGSGNFPKILGDFVRVQHVLTLEEALHKMTVLPAETFHLEGRGRIAPGYAADLTIFNPDVVAATSTYDRPLDEPVGIDWVFVNGVLVSERNRIVEAFPGQPIRRPGATSLAGAPLPR